MGWLHKKILRPLLFLQEAETAHNRAVNALAFASRSELACRAVETFFAAPELPVEVFGLKFPNPVGLAAGMDKAAVAVPGWAALGFGFSEIGGVTWHAQPGNPQPRLFRAPAAGGLVNRMGFNNPGAEAVAKTLRDWKDRGRWPAHPVGINLGKSKITPLAKAAEDYASSFRALRQLADFFVVNVSSPNTPGLRELQDKSALDEILAAIQEQNGIENSKLKIQDVNKPVLVKIAPDLSFEAIDDILELVGPRRIAGLVATNTTISRPQTSDVALQKTYAEAGGLSGQPLRSRSTEIIRHLHRQTQGRLPVIGVGGIFSAEDAWEKFTAGASLVQIYTGLVFEGPGIAGKIVRALRKKVKEAGFQNLSAAVGSAGRS